MGCYLNNFGENAQGKATTLMEDHGARAIRPGFIDPETGEVAVCVVSNPGTFDACLVVHDRHQFDRCTAPNDARPTIWLVLPVEFVRKHADNFDEYLKESKDV